MNSASLADRVASLLPNTTAAATDSPQACNDSCNDLCGSEVKGGVRYYYLAFWICCGSGCWSQGCGCELYV